MFIQNYQNGAIHKEGLKYTLRIDGLKIEGDSIQIVLSKYSNIMHRAVTNKKVIG